MRLGETPNTSPSPRRSPKLPTSSHLGSLPRGFRTGGTIEEGCDATATSPPPPSIALSSVLTNLGEGTRFSYNFSTKILCRSDRMDGCVAFGFRNGLRPAWRLSTVVGDAAERNLSFGTYSLEASPLLLDEAPEEQPAPISYTEKKTLDHLLERKTKPRRTDHTTGC
jgi:hypothetical protein